MAPAAKAGGEVAEEIEVALGEVAENFNYAEDATSYFNTKKGREFDVMVEMGTGMMQWRPHTICRLFGFRRIFI